MGKMSCLYDNCFWKYKEMFDFFFMCLKLLDHRNIIVLKYQFDEICYQKIGLHKTFRVLFY